MDTLSSGFLFLFLIECSVIRIFDIINRFHNKWFGKIITFDQIIPKFLSLPLMNFPSDFYEDFELQSVWRIGSFTRLHQNFVQNH